MARIFERARELGLALCPLELGPRLRLEYLGQLEGYSCNSLQQQQAPSSSITITSEILTEDDEFPRGFYLRQLTVFCGFVDTVLISYTFGTLMIILSFIKKHYRTS